MFPLRELHRKQELVVDRGQLHAGYGCSRFIGGAFFFMTFVVVIAFITFLLVNCGSMVSTLCQVLVFWFIIIKSFHRLVCPVMSCIVLSPLYELV